jgi:hypothetical protein
LFDCIQIQLSPSISTEKDVVCALLGTVLDAARAPHLDLFLQFLQQSTHQRITLDQWDSFLQFNLAVPLALTGYDDDGACTYENNLELVVC